MFKLVGVHLQAGKILTEEIVEISAVPLHGIIGK